MTRKEQLKADLLKNFSDFQKIKEPGGSTAANSIVAEGLAESIDRAIDDGVEFRFQGVFAVKDINAIQEKAPGYLYTCSDSGILKAKTELPVVKNTVVLWNGEDFKTFLVIPEATGSSVQISVDSFLSTLSGNPVQNKVVTTAINALSEALASEAAARASADTALGGRIDAEATARENADAALQGNIDAEETAREDADATLQSNIESEAAEREQADGELQAQIDAISSKSDVVDVVASYVELVAYDTSALGDNDVIKVLEDETHDDAESYYRWNLTTQTWGYIGSQGPFVTPAEMQTALNGKVDKVTGKGLSTNDYTTAEKNKLAGIAEGADKSPVKFFSFTTKYSNLVAAYDDGYRIFLTGVITGEYPFIYSMVTFDRTNEEMVFAAVRDGGMLCTIKKASRYGTAFLARDYPLAPQSHASSDTTYGTGTSSNYGHVKLSSDTSSTSGVNDGVAATPSAVKSAYDLANSKYSKLSGGIPYNDMSSGVKASLDKADSALQQHQSLDGYVNGVTADSTTSFGDSSTIVVGKSGKNMLTRTASALWTYIKGKADSVYAELIHTHTTSQITDFPDIPTFGNSWVVHKNFNTATYALRITIPYSVRTAGTSFLVMTSCNNGNKSLFSIHFWKSTNSAITNISVKHIYGDKDTVVANKVYYEPGSSAYDAHVYIASNSSSEFSTSFAILCNSQEMTGNTSNISFDTVSRSVATSATVVADKSYVEQSYSHSNEINYKNVPLGSSKNHWFNYRNGDTDANDSENTVGLYLFGNRNKTVNDVTIFANTLRLGRGDASSSNTKYGELGFDASAGITTPLIFLYGQTDPRFGVFNTEAHSGTSAHGVMLSAESGGNVGVWGYINATGGSGWICYKGMDNVSSLGKSSDTVVRLGSKKLDFSGTFGSDSNTLYFV